MRAITYALHLEAPVLAAAPEGDPNSGVTLPYIPGSLMRGAMVGCYLREHSAKDLATEPRARDLFFNGTTRFLNAYLEGPGGERGLPVPLSWKVQKRRKEPIYDLSVKPEPDPDLGKDEIWQPKSLKGGFCTLQDDGVTVVQPDMQISIHTQRDRVKGRATEDRGAVFRYEALAAGQVFRGVILCEADEMAEELLGLLKTDALFLGGSRHAGYGRVRVFDVSATDGWVETGAEPDAVSQGGGLTFTLLSDAVVRDDTGECAGTLGADLLAEELGVSVSLNPDGTHARTAVVGGFNRKWGLPLRQELVAKAGSVYTFTAEEDLPAHTLNGLMEQGIGARRAEGFGRVACNWHATYGELIRLDPEEEKPRAAVTLTGSSARIAQRMANRMLRARLDRQLRERVNAITVHGDISNTQLSEVRVRVRSALAGTDTRAVEDHLSQMAPTAKDQFEDAQIGDQSLLNWLQGVLGEPPSALWERLFRTSFVEEDLPAVGGVPAKWDGALAAEYRLRLIDGVMSRKLELRRSKNA